LFHATFTVQNGWKHKKHSKQSSATLVAQAATHNSVVLASLSTSNRPRLQ